MHSAQVSDTRGRGRRSRLFKPHVSAQRQLEAVHRPPPRSPTHKRLHKPSPELPKTRSDRLTRAIFNLQGTITEKPLFKGPKTHDSVQR